MDAGDLAARAAIDLGAASETAQRRRAYAYGNIDLPYIPMSGTPEYRRIADRARLDIIGLVLDAYCQAITVEAFHNPAGVADPEAWRLWQASGLPLRESALTRAALTHGATYLVIEPGAPFPAFRHVAADRMAYYADPAAPTGTPLYAVEWRGPKQLIVYLSDSVWRVDLDKPVVVPPSPAGLPTIPGRPITSSDLGTSLPGFAGPLAGAPVVADVLELVHVSPGVVPVVRLAVELDDRDQPVSEVQRLILPQDRVTQTLFDLMMVQTYGAFRVRTVTGFAPKDDTEQVKIAVNRVLAHQSDKVHWGTLDVTPLAPYIQVFNGSVDDLLRRVQLPPHRAGGVLADNLSAEAQAQIDSGFVRRVEQRQRGLSIGYGAALDIASRVTDVPPGLVPEWADPSMQPLGAVVDAISKLSAGGLIPPRRLLEKVPGLSMPAMAADAIGSAIASEGQG